MDALAVIEFALQLLAGVSKLLPEIEQSVGTVEATLSSNDPAELRAKIAEVHAVSQGLTAQLDALKSK